MFIYDFKENKIPSKDSFVSNIDTEFELIDSQINYTTNLKNMYINSFGNITENSENYPAYNNQLQSFDNSISELEELQSLLEDFKLLYPKDESSLRLSEFQVILQDYYDKRINVENTVLKTTNEVVDVLYTNNVDFNTAILEFPVTKPKETRSHFGIVDQDTLIISEKEGKLFLPYKACDVETRFLGTPYTTIEDFIQNEYILPLDKFKNSTLARFREAYNLVMNKDHGSIAHAVALGLELMYNYSLHPAIISACKCEDELDIYLDCLSSNELNDFDIFNVKFELAPTLNMKNNI